MLRRAHDDDLVVAFDADDTLWHNEPLFNAVQQRFTALLAPYCSAEEIDRRLYDVEIRNLRFFGYGIKGFTLSMIESAIELTGGRISGVEIGRVLDFAREMSQAPVRVIDGVPDVLAALAPQVRLMLITKGDLFDQETKLARSGLADWFRHIQIVSDKTPVTYRGILRDHAIAAERFVMVGNSPRSDILPVLAIGGQAVYLPYHTTWAHEQADHLPEQPGLYQIDHIGQVVPLVTALRAGMPSSV
jgi:putative hydrolase of the HAD superfamily